MKQILSSIGILLLLVFFSISDFNLGNFPDASDTVTDWDASQTPACLDYELSDRVTDGSDGSNVAAAIEMQMAMDRYKTDCLYLTNTGHIPSAENPVTRQWLEKLLADDGGPVPYN